MYKILVIRLYFLLDALDVSDYHQEQPFISCTSHLVYAGTIRLTVVWLITRILCILLVYVHIDSDVFTANMYTVYSQHIEHPIGSSNCVFAAGFNVQ